MSLIPESLRRLFAAGAVAGSAALGAEATHAEGTIDEQAQTALGQDKQAEILEELQLGEVLGTDATADPSEKAYVAEIPTSSESALKANLDSMGLTLADGSGTLTPPGEDIEMPNSETGKGMLRLMDTQDGSPQTAAISPASQEICNLLNVPESEREFIKIIDVPPLVNIRDFPSTEIGVIQDKTQYPSSQFVARLSEDNREWWEAECVLVPTASGRGFEIIPISPHVYFFAELTPPTGEPSFPLEPATAPELPTNTVDVPAAGPTDSAPHLDQPGIEDGGGSEPPTDTPTETEAPTLSVAELEGMGTPVAAEGGVTSPAVLDGEPTPILLENVPVINGVPTLYAPVPTLEAGLSSSSYEWFTSVSNSQRAVLESWNLPDINLGEVQPLILGGREVPIGLIENPRLYEIPVISSDDLLTVAGYYRGLSRLENIRSNIESYGYVVDTQVNGQIVRFMLLAPNNPNISTNLGRIVPNANVQFTPTSEVLEAIRNTDPGEPIIFQVWNSLQTDDLNYSKFLHDQREATRAILSGEDVEGLPVGLITPDALYLPVPND